jgi:phage-related protein
VTTFPVLKTGVVAQYPLERGVRFSTESVRFLDGSQQRFKLFNGGLRRWVVRLDLLDEQELGALIDFVEATGDTPFAFTDPVAGTTATNCIIGGERFDANMTGEMTGQATIVIEEIA